MEKRIAPNQREIRTIELRAGNNFEIVARAAKYNSLSEDLGGFKEVLLPGCFSDALKNQDETYCCVNHDPSQILGRTRNGSLMLQDRADGLYFTCKLNPNVQAHRDLYELVKAGTLSECSFAFNISKEGQSWDDSQTPVLRRISKVSALVDVAIVTLPAYANSATAAEARKAGAAAAPAQRKQRIAALERKLNAALIEVLELRKGPYAEKNDATAMDELYGCASRFAQAAYQCSDIISDTLADWDAQDDDDRGCLFNHDNGRSYRDSHAACRTALQNANTLLAGARAKLKYWLQK